MLLYHVSVYIHDIYDVCIYIYYTYTLPFQLAEGLMSRQVVGKSVKISRFPTEDGGGLGSGDSWKCLKMS